MQSVKYGDTVKIEYICKYFIFSVFRAIINCYFSGKVIVTTLYFLQNIKKGRFFSGKAKYYNNKHKFPEFGLNVFIQNNKKWRQRWKDYNLELCYWF